MNKEGEKKGEVNCIRDKQGGTRGRKERITRNTKIMLILLYPLPFCKFI